MPECKFFSPSMISHWGSLSRLRGEGGKGALLGNPLPPGRTRPPREASRPRLPPLVRVALLAAVYFIAAKLGLKLAFLHVSATPVWPPTGIALAALLVLGLRVWPGILAGAFLANVTTAGSAITCLGIATGNTLEGVMGAWLVCRLARGQRAFERPQDVFKFAALAGIVSTTVSATFGVTSLSLGGYAAWANYWSIWLTWWLGDMGGALVVAPLLLLWGTTARPRWDRRRILEATLLLASLVLVGLVIFDGLLSGLRNYPLPFITLPLLLWAAFRFEQREAATATAVLSGLAIWGALHGYGPFVRASPNETLLLLQAFMGVMGVTTLAVAAGVSERRRAERDLVQAAAIVRSSDEAILGKTLDGTIVSWNRGAEALYGYTAAEVQGRPISILVPPDRHNEITDILEKIRSGKRIEHYETVRIRRDGGRLSVSLAVSPILDPDGRIIGASAIAHDITEKQRADRRLATQFAITRLLTEAPTVRAAAPRLLQTLCEGLEWDLGELWRVDADAHALRPEARWPASVVGATGKDAARSDEAIARGEDLPGQVWESGRYVWLDATAGTLGRTRAAAAGFQAALACPLRVDKEMVGVLALYSRESRALRQEIIDIVSDISSRIGQFMERERTLEGLWRLQKAVETVKVGVTITDAAGRILYTNPAEAAMHGYGPQELIGKHVRSFMPPQWRPASGQPAEMGSWRRETVNVRRDGTIFPVQLISDAVLGPDGRTIAIVTCSEEITERKRAEEALRSSEERYRLLFERNLAGVYRATLDGRLLECNEAFARILGYSSRDEVLAHSAWDLFFNREDREAFVARLKEKGSLTNFEVRIRRRDGTSLWALENETLIPGKDGADLVEGTIIDITERKVAEEKIEFHAYHDPLTGLPNRMFLKDRLHLALAQARRSGRGFAVLWLDLDHFKEINDTLGHGVGDRILQDVAARLRDCVREEDAVARLGGDEFLLLLVSVRQKDEAALVAKKILSRVGEPFRVDGHELHVTTSAGIALFPQDGEDAGTLLKNADGAMYQAKEHGRNSFQICDQAAQRHTLERLDLNNRLRIGLEHEEMALFYQPQVELTTGRIVGAEALLRWLHPERGLLLPAEFLPLAEEMGLIVPLGEWVLRKACGDARGWADRGLPPVRISVNVSVRQFQQSRLRKTLEEVLEETGLSRRRLELEVSENAARQNLDVTVPVLRELVGLGIGISIDDFGAWHSLPGYLKGLPIRRLKIDRPLVTSLGREEPRETGVVRRIIEMAHNLGHRVVAEGVETQFQLDVLRGLECDEIQGWVFSEPLPEAAFGRLLGASNPLYWTE
ncbi:MAG TPA: PAS domain S-box protein [Vicinamibacteria bacterium]|jgi:diguanylate cyclase (GGDEF)-like protein/PAS domain S-box-containing protein|nr:PAS domain S-box protein [Vicinamibacteria bacterium]